MQLSVEISEEQAIALRSLADKFGLSQEELAKAAVVDLIVAPRDDFYQAAKAVLVKNDELYKRLA